MATCSSENGSYNEQCQQRFGEVSNSGVGESILKPAIWCWIKSLFGYTGADAFNKPAAIAVEGIRYHASLPGRHCSSRADTLSGDVCIAADGAEEMECIIGFSELYTILCTC